MSTAKTKPGTTPTALSERALARRIGRSAAWVAARRREGRITPVCFLPPGQWLYLSFVDAELALVFFEESARLGKRPLVTD
jgi:hypothetical protein